MATSVLLMSKGKAAQCTTKGAGAQIFQADGKGDGMRLLLVLEH